MTSRQPLGAERVAPADGQLRDANRLEADIRTEMDGVRRECADRRGSLLFRCLDITPSVGREEAREAIREEFDRWNRRNGNRAHCSIQFIDQLTDCFLALLSPGAPDELVQKMHELPSPGAPQGWREPTRSNIITAKRAAEAYCLQVQGFTYGDRFVIRDLNREPGLQIVWEGPATEDSRAIGERMRGCHDGIIADHIIAALTPSSSEAAEEAASNKRLRQWLDYEDTMLFHAIGMAVSVKDGSVSVDTDTFRSTLKDCLLPEEPTPSMQGGSPVEGRLGACLAEGRCLSPGHCGGNPCIHSPHAAKPTAREGGAVGGCGPDCPLSPEEHAAIDEIAAGEMLHTPLREPTPREGEGGQG